MGKTQGPLRAIRPSLELSQTLQVNLKKKAGVRGGWGGGGNTVALRTLNSLSPATIIEPDFPNLNSVIFLFLQRLLGM